jgi:hypothetical protein
MEWKGNSVGMVIAEQALALSSLVVRFASNLSHLSFSVFSDGIFSP